MIVGVPMQAKRVDKQPHELAPGEYMARRDSDTGKLTVYACTPNGLLGNLDNHEVTENDDGTITVSPSILVGEGAKNVAGRLEWHGYLERDVWREV